MSNCDCHIEIKDQSQRQVLVKLLAINLFMFVIEFGVGWYAQSTGLIADAMDMLADAIVYGIGLYAVARTITHKAHAAADQRPVSTVVGTADFDRYCSTYSAWE